MPVKPRAGSIPELLIQHLQSARFLGFVTKVRTAVILLGFQ
jgi:hypothetical protein